MTKPKDKAKPRECSEKGCKNMVPVERLEMGYDYCTNCSSKKHHLRKSKTPIVLEGYDVEELRRAW